MKNIISFRKIKNSDDLLIRNWIKTNEFVKKWYYENKIPNLKTINKKIHRANIDSFIVLIDGKEVGYIQCYLIDNFGSWAEE